MTKIDASPTKQFFISMLTRDVALDRSILDLVDNSVDAAVRSGDLSNKKIEIDVSADSFIIKDNCGGIRQSDAEEYAFRFGRAENNPESPHSVGQFGVGLKRTLFKIGDDFEITSSHSESQFVVVVNVPSWINEPKWEFELTPKRVTQPEGGAGTKIVVTSLKQSVSEQFSLDSFAREIIEEVSKAHFKVISQGLKIIVNREEVGAYTINIISSEELVGISQKFVLEGPVDVDIKVGFSERDFHAAGWNVICNGRLVIGSEVSEVTGWGVDQVSRYHPDYAFFRGVVEFEAENSSLLPWTTTKTGVDADNPVYRQVLSHMKVMMRQVLPLMKDRAAEQKAFNDGKIEETPLVDAFKCENLVDIYSAMFGSELVSPARADITNSNPMATIQYKIPSRKAEIAKRTIGVTTNKEVGENTFQYFYDLECDDE